MRAPNRTIADVALDYSKRGWKPVPVSRNSKRPIGKQWQNEPFSAAQFDGNKINVGVQFGSVSGGLVDVDLDSMTAVTLAQHFLPQTAATFGRCSKPCSHQLYISDLCKTEKRAAIQFEYADDMIVELRIGGAGKGAFTVFPPSMHVSGEMVEWVSEGEPAQVAGAELKSAVTRLFIACVLVQAYPKGVRHKAALALGGVLARSGWQADEIKHLMTVVARHVGDDEVNDRAIAAASAVEAKANGDAISGLPKFTELWGDDAAKSLKKWLHYQDPLPPAPMGYMKGINDLVCNVGNIMLALETEPELISAFAYDEMMRTEVLLRPLFSEKPDFKPRPVTDADVTVVQAWLQRFGFLKLGKDVTHDAINKHARDHAFHPIRDYLNGLRWDRTERVGTWPHTYLGAENNKYTSKIGTMFLIGMVARIFEPGCKLDYMPILEGDQGEYKSKTCETLAGPEYFTDQLPDITSKECSQHLRGKWLVEVAELRAYSRAEVDHFKEFLVRQVERYRPPWGRKEVHEPRQCSFIGTTNKAHYFRDETGNRRYWPVTTGNIKLDDLRRDRDQLFAEAVELYRAGEPWWPDREFEQEHIVPEQESRYEPDVWEPLVKDHLDILHLPKKTTILQIAIDVLGYEIEPPLIRKDDPQPRKTPINRFTIKDQGRVAGILEHLGWEPKRSKSERWWQPGPKALTR
jgi:predicted P-loop ATPase